MMPAVLAGPPVVADPGAEVAARDTEDGVGPPGPEDLAVPGVVAEEADLGEDRREEHRVSRLPPRVSDGGERGPAECERRRGERDLPRVVPRPAVEQARLPHLPGQGGVVTATRAGRRRRHGGSSVSGTAVADREPQGRGRRQGWRGTEVTRIRRSAACSSCAGPFSGAVVLVFWLV